MAKKKTTKTSKKTTKTSVSKTVTSYVKSAAKEPKQPAKYTPSTNNVTYTPVQNDVGEYVPGQFTSRYQPQIDEALNKVTNWSYDPMQDANYQALAKVYEARGNIAAKNSVADAAALNGGFGTSYAVSAAQQARNQYNQELASMIPEYSQQAYNRLTTNYGMLQDTYNLWKDLDTEAYGRYRDRVADYQWGKGYDTDIYQYKEAQKKSSSGGGGGGGGGRRRRSGGGGGSYGNGSVTDDNYLKGIYEDTAKKLNGSKTQGPKPNVPVTIATIAKAAANNTNKKKNKK